VTISFLRRTFSLYRVYNNLRYLQCFESLILNYATCANYSAAETRETESDIIETCLTCVVGTASLKADARFTEVFCNTMAFQKCV